MEEERTGETGTGGGGTFERDRQGCFFSFLVMLRSVLLPCARVNVRVFMYHSLAV